MCTIWALKALFLAVLDPKVSNNYGFCLFSKKKFSLVSHQYSFTCSLQTFYMWWEYERQRSNFWVTLNPKLVKIPVFCHFHKIYNRLVSHQSWFTWQFALLLDVCSISASDTRFPGHFGPQSWKWLWPIVLFSNICHWFHILVVSHAYSGMSRCILR